MVTFTIINKNDVGLSIGQVFFLHPAKFFYRGGGWFGTTAVEPREDLGDVLIDTTHHQTHILNSWLTIKIPPNSSSSFILKYSFLNESNELYNDWSAWRDEMILGIRYYAPYETSGSSIQEAYAPLYATTKVEFEGTLQSLFQSIKDEWEKIRASQLRRY